MKKNKQSVFGACFLPIIGLFILACVTGIATLSILPEQAQKKFGPPAQSLGGLRKYTLAAALLLQAGDLLTPVDPGVSSNGAEVPFSILPGESTTSIIGRLWQAGLISNPGAFRSYLQYTGLDTSIQAGEYTLTPTMTSVEIARVFQSAPPGKVIFTMLAGWRIEEVAAVLPFSGLEILPTDFLQAARTIPDGFSFSLQIPQANTIEGFLFPGTYELARETSLVELLNLLWSAFDRNLSAELLNGYTKNNLSLYEAITLASIIQREAVITDEMPMIASVFFNRLRIEMPLASDPTVQYARGYNPNQDTWWTNPLSAADLQIDSPFNTYLYPGLPPAPIASPGLDALKAVAFPAQTPYYYFRAACDGSGHHNFAETYEEHLQNACP